MKILGFTMIILSSTLLALTYVQRKKDRIFELSSLCTALELMQGEVCEKLCPLPELAENLAQRCNGRAAEFFTHLSGMMSCLGELGFSSIWNDCCQKSLYELKDKELKAFSELSLVLGRYDVQSQKAALDECRNLLLDAKKKDSADFSQHMKLSLGLSLSAGSLLAIVLI